MQQTHRESNTSPDKILEDQGTASLPFSQIDMHAQNLPTLDQLLPVSELTYPSIIPHSGQHSGGLDTQDNDTAARKLYDVNLSGRKIDECYTL